MTGKRSVSVMTYNLYFGGDLDPVIAAADVGMPEFIEAASQAWVEAHQTGFEERLEAVGDLIMEHEPHLVGLQEVALWRTGPLFGSSGAESIDVDFLALLLGSLANRELEYEVVAAVEGIDVAAPLAPLGFDGRLTISDVLLVRDGLPSPRLQLSNPQTGTYAASITRPIAAPLPPIFSPRQWASVDVELRGKSFRFLTTHLEAESRPTRVAQASELLEIHGGTGLPLVVVGDFNAEPGDPGDGVAVLLDSGLVDDVFAGAIGGTPTCCQNASLDNAVSGLSARVDLILAGGFEPGSAQVLGMEPGDKTPSGRWPSDHAGVVGELYLLD